MKTWHERIVHVNEKCTRRLILDFDLPIGNKSMNKCTSCCLGKLHKLPSSPKSSSPSSSVLEFLFMDIWRPSLVVSLDGALYYINFLGAYSKYIWLYPITKKIKCSSYFHSLLKLNWKATWETNQGSTSDSGGEFIVFQYYLNENDIVRHKAC